MVSRLPLAWLEKVKMSPHPMVAPPQEEELLEITPVELPPAGPKGGPPGDSGRESPGLPILRKPLLADSLLELSDTRPRHRTIDFVFSVIVHGLFLAVLLLLPLYFTESIDLRQFTQTFLVAPPPPPPPPPPAAPTALVKVGAPRRVFTTDGKLLAPVAIPSTVAMLKEEPLPPDIGAGGGVVGGVPGGVPGGQIGGVIGGIITGAARTNVPLPPPTAAPSPRAPIRVGGRLKAPRAISQPQPVYPPLAMQARLQGDVLIDAVIDEHGNIVEMQAVSGHPLLIPAAMEALKKWKYEPTILNEQAVPVQLIVTIKFRLQ